MGPSHSEKLDNANLFRTAGSVARSTAECAASEDHGTAAGSYRVRTRQLGHTEPQPKGRFPTLLVRSSDRATSRPLMRPTWIPTISLMTGPRPNPRQIDDEKWAPPQISSTGDLPTGWPLSTGGADQAMIR